MFFWGSCSSGGLVLLGLLFYGVPVILVLILLEVWFLWGSESFGVLVLLGGAWFFWGSGSFGFLVLLGFLFFWVLVLLGCSCSPRVMVVLGFLIMWG